MPSANGRSPASAAPPASAGGGPELPAEEPGELPDRLAAAPEAVVVERELRPAAATELRVDDVGYRRHAGYRLLGEEADADRERADQLAVDVEGAPAHAVGHPLELHKLAPQADQHQVDVRAQGAAHHAEHLGLHLLHLGATEGGPDDAGHARLDAVHRHQLGLGGGRGAAEQQQRQGRSGACGSGNRVFLHG